MRRTPARPAAPPPLALSPRGRSPCPAAGAILTIGRRTARSSPEHPGARARTSTWSSTEPDLSGANLAGAQLSGASLCGLPTSRSRDISLRLNPDAAVPEWSRPESGEPGGRRARRRKVSANAVLTEANARAPRSDGRLRSLLHTGASSGSEIRPSERDEAVDPGCAGVVSTSSCGAKADAPSPPGRRSGSGRRALIRRVRSAARRRGRRGRARRENASTAKAIAAATRGVVARERRIGRGRGEARCGHRGVRRERARPLPEMQRSPGSSAIATAAAVERRGAGALPHGGRRRAAPGTRARSSRWRRPGPQASRRR